MPWGHLLIAPNDGRWCWDPAPQRDVMALDEYSWRLRFGADGSPQIVFLRRFFHQERSAQEERLRSVFYYVRDRFCGGPEGLGKVLCWDELDKPARIIELQPKITTEVEADDAEDSEPA
jgi:hypothetical protein